jgi:GAG-pre-integrase domain
MDSVLISMVERVGVRGSEMSTKKVLILNHQRMEHPSFNVLSRLYPSLFEKTDKSKLICDACEFSKLTRSSYVSSGHMSFYVFDLIYSDILGPYFMNFMNDYRYFVTFIDYFLVLLGYT